MLEGCMFFEGKMVQKGDWLAWFFWDPQSRQNYEQFGRIVEVYPPGHIYGEEECEFGLLTVMFRPAVQERWDGWSERFGGNPPKLMKADLAPGNNKGKSARRVDFEEVPEEFRFV